MSTKYEATFSGEDQPNRGPTKYKKPTFLYVLTFLSTIGGFLFGYDTGVVSGAMLLIRQEYNLSTAWHEAIVSATIGAAWLFALIGGWLTDTFGRKPVILLASLTFTGGSILMGLATGKEMLLAGRIVVGVGIGLLSTSLSCYSMETAPIHLHRSFLTSHVIFVTLGQLVASAICGAFSKQPHEGWSMSVPVYIAESALSEDRGTLVTLNTILITGGQFVASAVCGALSTYEHGWRYMLGLAAIPGVIQFVGFLGMPESPRWLVSKGKHDEAIKVLRSIRGCDFPIEAELESIKAAHERDHSDSVDSTWIKVLRTPSTRRALILGCLLQAFQQIAGINTVMYYSASIIQMAGVNDFSVAIWLACLTAAVNFLCTFIGLFLVERVGRRPLTLGSLGGVFISLIILGVSFHLMGLDSPAVELSTSDSCGVASTCAECVGSSLHCGFCYLNSGLGIANSSCWLQNPDDITTLPLGGMCSNKTIVGPATGVTWAVGWCPSKYSWMAVTALGIYLLFFAPGMGPMPWTINSEIYPTWARSFCNSVATSTNWMFNLIISMTFLTLTEVLTREGTFYLYAGFAGAGLILFSFILPETRGKTLEEMETLFSGPLTSRSGLPTSSKSIHDLKDDDQVSSIM